MTTEEYQAASKEELWTKVLQMWPQAMEYQSAPDFPAQASTVANKTDA